MTQSVESAIKMTNQDLFKQWKEDRANGTK